MARTQSTTRRRHLDETYGQSARLVEELEAEENALIDRDVETGLDEADRIRLHRVQSLLRTIHEEKTIREALSEDDPRLAERAADRPPTPARRVVRPQMPSAPGMEEPGDGGPARPSLPPAEDGPPRRLRVVRPSRPQAA